MFGVVSRIKPIKKQVNTVKASYVKSEVHMTVGVNIAIMWYRPPCSLVDRHRHFRGTHMFTKLHSDTPEQYNRFQCNLA